MTRQDKRRYRVRGLIKIGTAEEMPNGTWVVKAAGQIRIGIKTRRGALAMMTRMMNHCMGRCLCGAKCTKGPHSGQVGHGCAAHVSPEEAINARRKEG